MAFIQSFAAKRIADFSQQQVNGTARKENAQQWDYLRSDYLSSLITRRRKDPEDFTLDDVLYHLLPHVAAGGEATGVSTSAAVYYLCKHPKILHKLREESDEVSKNRKMGDWMTIKEAQDCSYLQGVIKETIRLFPPIGLGLPCIVSKGGLTVANVVLPEGVRLLRPLHYLHGL